MTMEMPGLPAPYAGLPLVVRASPYAHLARAWAVVFAAVGSAFLLAPRRSTDALNRLAGALGLRGEIGGAGGELWWVLAVSLMATVTVLAEASARRPDDAVPFTALLTAKLVSTVLFAGLAIGRGGAWALCALGDGFVAASLVFARRNQTRTGFPDGARQGGSG